MNLHEQSQDFQELVTNVSQQLKIEEIYIEKDYFVVLALKHLSQSDHRANGIFKGGTSLSKAYGAINRFSEDIDMAILNDNGSDIGNRRRMERVERALTSNECFTEDPDHLRVKKGSWLRQTVHNYPLLSEVVDFGQVSKHIFVDVSRISPGLPFEEQNINTYIHDYLIADGQKSVIEEFQLQPIPLNVLSIERTFAEKFGTVVKFSSQPDGKGTQPLDRLKSGIRHIYDLHMLIKDQRIQLFTQGVNQVDGMNFNQFMERVLRDDLQGMREEGGYSQYMNSEFSQCFLYKDPVAAWQQLQATYEGDFKRLLFRNHKSPTSAEIISSLKILRELCHQFDEWKKKNNISFGD